MHSGYYFYMKLTHRPDEILFLNVMTKQAGGPMNDLDHNMFVGRLVSGFVMNNNLYLVDPVTRCVSIVHNFERLHNRMNLLDSFIVKRINLNIEDVMACDHHEARPNSTNRCSQMAVPSKEQDFGTDFDVLHDESKKEEENPRMPNFQEKFDLKKVLIIYGIGICIGLALFAFCQMCCGSLCCCRKGRGSTFLSRSRPRKDPIKRTPYAKQMVVPKMHRKPVTEDKSNQRGSTSGFSSSSTSGLETFGKPKAAIGSSIAQQISFDGSELATMPTSASVHKGAKL